ncbi:MAG TPA: tetratricopeptide repeat protein [Oculatellaceae cyanobacterium]
MTWKDHLGKGSLALAREDYPFAQSELNRALQDLEKDSSDKRSLGLIYGLLAQAFFRHSNFEEAEPLLKQAIELEKLDNSNLSVSARARDLICLAEILRNKGCLAESLDCVESAMAPEPAQNLEDVSGSEEFDALKTLFAVASAGQGKSSNKKSAAQASFSNSKHSVNAMPSAQTKTGARKGKTQSPDTENLLESYKQKLDYLNNVESKNSTRPEQISTALELVTISLQLNFLEQAEQFLHFAFVTAFGKSHGKLSIPTNGGQLPPETIIRLMMAKSELFAFCQDYAAAARACAELMKWLEKHHEHLAEHTQNNPLETGEFIARFIQLTQKADLYASARLLIKQALELEDCGEFDKSIAIYDKALAIFSQLFPADHLEVAQVLQFKAALLELSGRQNEADALNQQAQDIEEKVGASAQQVETRLESLPQFRGCD